MNPYIKNPLYVAQVDPKTNNNIAVYFFLGSVPKYVLNAANNGYSKGSDPRILTWNSKDSAILEKFYGKGWKKLLTAENPAINESITDKKDLPLFFSYVGGKQEGTKGKQGTRSKQETRDKQEARGKQGARGQQETRDKQEDPQENLEALLEENLEDDENTKSDLEFFEKNDITDFFDEEGNIEDDTEINIKLFDESRTSALSDYTSTIMKNIRPPVYLPISIYPEDTIYDLRLKIHLATGIEFFRQHVFYYVNNEGPAIPYQFNVDNIPSYINYRDLYKKENNLCNIHIDSFLEKRRDGIQIKAMDTFITLQIIEGVRVNAVYFIDLYNVLMPLDYPQRPNNDNLSQILKDKYQIDILYYGAIIKYWPHLSIDIMNIALTSPQKMGIYPLLAHNIKHLKERFKSEQLVANLSTNYKQSISIIGATIKIFSKSAKVRCLIRNIFDWVETNSTIMMLNAKFDIESALLSESGMNLVSIHERQGEFISITGLKKYSTSQNPKYVQIAEWFLNNRVESNTVMIAILRENSIRSPFIYLTLYANGEYKVTGEWEEDDKVDFDQIIKELSVISKPIIENINLMGVAAFPLGGEYYIIKEKSDAVLRYITGSILYPQYFSDSMFNELRKKIKLLETANIIKIKNFQKSEIISFLFVKGIISYDLKLANRAESGNAFKNKGDNYSNQYAWLFNSIVFNRWETSFSGRLIKIYHRATDIKIEIINADNIEEFNLIQKYIISYIEYVYNSSNFKDIKITNNGSEKAKKKLKKLQENDPNLFDLKKYDQKNKVYSVLCQSNRQPFSYTENEIKSFTDKRKKHLVKYWNFTENVPAYYECPHAKFPHLSLRPNQHPMGYCIPCCNMALPPVNSKTAKSYDHCLKHKKGDIVKVDEISKHVLSYGKSINVGRISEIGKEIRDELFLGKLNKNNMLYLIGVEQFLPSVHDAGFTYSIIFLIKNKNQTIEDKIKELANYVRNMKDNFYNLGNGSGMLYKSSDDLADDILNIFIYKKEMNSILEKSGQILTSWNLILVDLVKKIHNINIVTFIEEEEESFSLEGDTNFISNYNLVFILKNNNGFYPVIMTNIKQYIKQLTNLLPIEDVCIKQFNKNKNPEIYNIIENIFIDDKNISILPILELENAIKGSSYKITSLMINLSNYCYGALITNTSGKNNEEFYFPINYSSYFSYTEYNILYNSIKESNIPNLKILEDFIKKTNLNIIHEYNIINNENKYIGFKSKNICYLFKESDEPYKSTTSIIENIIFPYSIININNEILKYIKGKKTNTILDKYKPAVVRNRLYKYFIAEFSSILMNDKNIEMRKKLIELLSETKFDSSNSLTALRIKLIKFLKDYSNDLILIKEIISKSFILSAHNPLKHIIKYINSTFFEFDRQKLYNLKKLDHISLIKELKNMMNNNIYITDEKNINISNLYTSCNDKSAILKNQCKNNKLMVPSNTIEDFYSILAMDIKNPTKTKLLTSLSAGIFDSMDFIRRENETLDIFIEN